MSAEQGKRAAELHVTLNKFVDDYKGDRRKIQIGMIGGALSEAKYRHTETKISAPVNLKDEQANKLRLIEQFDAVKIELDALPFDNADEFKQAVIDLLTERINGQDKPQPPPR
jgi:hypothetical protein